MVARPSAKVFPFIQKFQELLEETFGLGVFGTWTGYNDAPRFTCFDLKYGGKVFLFWIKFKAHLDYNESALKGLSVDHDAIIVVNVRFHGHKSDDPILNINEFEMRLSDGPDTFSGIIDRIYESAY